MSLLSLLVGRATTGPAPAPLTIPELTGAEPVVASTLTAPYNAAGPLVLPSPYPSPSGTHPSVLDFGPDQKLSGYRWWMAYTPYYKANDDEENPFIVASNDRTTWVTPPGLEAPLAPFPGGSDYNSDTELIWDNETHAMWCYWRAVVSNKETVYARRSYDGVTWSPAYRLLETGTLTACLSPTVVKGHDGQWRMYSIGTSGNPSGYRTAPTPGGPWSGLTPISFDWAAAGSSQSPWHVYMRREYGQYRMLLNTNNGSALHPAVSEDGVNFRVGKTVLTSPPSGWDTGGIYRSCMSPHDNGADYDVWYATKGSGWQIAYTRIPKSHWQTL